MRRKIRAAVGLAFCVCVQGCDFVYSLLDKKGAEEKKLIGEVVPFEKNFTVEEIQTLLDFYGYSPGRIDGAMGLRTREAVARFQRDNGLEESRFVDRATWEKLTVFRKNGLVLNSDLNMKLIQTALQRAGFDPGPADGKSGLRTKAAVLKFQKSFGLKADGKIGYKTLTQLAAFLPPEETSPSP
jgi:peptidoglycan hydrolase-like protein with peptidoglycan-binding domain